MPAQEGRTRHQVLLEALDQGILALDPSDRITFANPAALRLLALERGEVAGRSIRDASWKVRALDGVPIEPDDFPVSVARAEGRAVRNAVLDVEGPNGLRRFLRVDAVPLEAGEEGSGDVLVTLRDATREVEEARRLRDSEGRHRAVMSHVGQVIFETDRGGRLTFLNPPWEKLTGTAVEESLGTDLVDHLHPADRQECRDALVKVLEGRRTYCRHEARVRSPAGERRWVEILGHPVPGPEKPRGAAGLVTDVTDRRVGEERIWRARRMEAMGELAGGVAHDFNNLLTIIMGHAQLMYSRLEEREEPDRILQEGAREIFRTSRRAADLIRQLLTFSRQQVLDREILDPNDLIRANRELIARFLPGSIRCNLELDPDVPTVEMSRSHLEQVLLNILFNARDALQGHPRGEIRVRTWRLAWDEPRGVGGLTLPAGTWANIEVSDDGAGMDPQTIHRVFEPFFTTKAHGAGMGLAAAYGIVAQVGGAIDVRSTPGQGSTFTVHLPAAEAPDRHG